MIADQTLFHGIAVIIDDEIHDPKASVREIQKAIEEAGCHVVPLGGIPNEASVTNLREVAFFVLDWNLYGASLKEIAGGDPVQPPASMVEENEENIVKFLRDLKKVRFAPVFIFTDEPVANIIDKLKHADLYDETDRSHILVMDKAQVSKTGLFTVLTNWMGDAPSVYVLKTWERAYEKAKNQLFLDFYVKSTLWPLILWKTFQDDSVPPATLLGDLLGRNLVSRMTPFVCDLEPFAGLVDGIKKDPKAYEAIVRHVLEGERFLASDRLDKESFEPGDIFEVADGYRINIRPDCDCIPKGNDKLDRLELYLLKGTERTFADLKYDAEYGMIPEQDNEAIIFPVYDGKALCFKFRKLYMQRWKDLKDKRVGRLLPPFLTRLQQRYSAYLQRPGLSRLPSVAFPSSPPQETASVIETVAAAPVESAPVQSEIVAEIEAPLVAQPDATPDQAPDPPVTETKRT
jgi:hypothetical protein